MSLDLTMLLADGEAVEMQIVNPKNNEPMVTAEGENISLMVVGTDSDAYVKISNAILNRRLKKASMSRKAQITADELESESLQKAVACVTGFKNIALSDGELEFSKANVERLLRTVPAIREQVEEFIVDRANFLK